MADYSAFREADALLAELISNASWKFMTDGGTLRLFDESYGTTPTSSTPATGALGGYSSLPAAAKDAAREILQEIYVGIPDEFIQMKKEGYDWYVEAPE